MEEKEYFLAYLSRATKLMQKAGHITNYLDLNDEDNREGIELEMRLRRYLQDKLTQVGISLAEIEKCNYFLKWQKRLDVAGVYDEDGDPICAKCLDEEDWDNIDQYEYEEIISRSESYERLSCAVCGKTINEDLGNTEPKKEEVRESE